MFIGLSRCFLEHQLSTFSSFFVLFRQLGRDKKEKEKIKFQNSEILKKRAKLIVITYGGANCFRVVLISVNWKRKNCQYIEDGILCG